MLLAGGGLGNAVLFSIAQALREAAATASSTSPATSKAEDLFKREEIEAATDQVIWSDGRGRARSRRGGRRTAHFRGNIVQAMVAYADGELGAALVPLHDGRPHHRHRLGPHDGGGARRRGTACSRRTCKPDHVGIGSINSPMQCMMKEVCAQCLQKHVDPATGKETIVFSCFNQDQELDRVDFANLAARLRRTPCRRS